MHPGFPKRSIITSRGNEPIRGLNGQGQYFYIALGDRAICIDRNLCTAANYTGSGGWTINPIVATITFGVTNVTSCIYIDRSQQVWFFRTGTSTVYAVNVNPNSDTFNQIVNTFTITGGTLQGASTPAYDYVRNRLIRSNGSSTAVIQQLNAGGTNIETTVSYTWPSNDSNISSGVFKYYNKIGSFLRFRTQNNVLSISSANLDNSTNIVVQLVAASVEGHGWSCEDYIYIQNNGSVSVVNERFELITTITANSRFCRPGYSESERMLISGSWFTNSVSLISKSSLTNVANIAKGFVGTNETGTREIVVSNRVAIAMPYSSSGASFVHVFDVVSRTYIGYINTPVALPDIGFYATGLIAKNRVEI